MVLAATLPAPLRVTPPFTTFKVAFAAPEPTVKSLETSRPAPLFKVTVSPEPTVRVSNAKVSFLSSASKSLAAVNTPSTPES